MKKIIFTKIVYRKRNVFYRIDLLIFKLINKRSLTKNFKEFPKNEKPKKKKYLPFGFKISILPKRPSKFEVFNSVKLKHNG